LPEEKPIILWKPPHKRRCKHPHKRLGGNPATRRYIDTSNMKGETQSMMNSFRQVFLPYWLQKLPDGRWVVLNREYKPLGFRTGAWVDYEDYPICVELKDLKPEKVSFTGHQQYKDRIYLYNDGCIPTDSDKHMKAYLQKIKELAKLEIV
jgi:hypothetical protein